MEAHVYSGDANDQNTRKFHQKFTIFIPQFWPGDVKMASRSRRPQLYYEEPRSCCHCRLRAVTIASTAAPPNRRYLGYNKNPRHLKPSDYSINILTIIYLKASFIHCCTPCCVSFVHYGLEGSKETFVVLQSRSQGLKVKITRFVSFSPYFQIIIREFLQFRARNSQSGWRISVTPQMGSVNFANLIAYLQILI